MKDFESLDQRGEDSFFPLVAVICRDALTPRSSGTR